MALGMARPNAPEQILVLREEKSFGLKIKSPIKLVYVKCNVNIFKKNLPNLLRHPFDFTYEGVGNIHIT